jgi:AraC family transcriptional regulator
MKKILILAIVLGGAALAAAWYAGMLSPITFTDQFDGPFYIVYEDHTGPYPLVQNVITDVTKSLDEANIQYGDAIAQFFDDPKVTPTDQLKSLGGVIVTGTVQVDSPLGTKIINYDHYAVATFNGLPMLGPNIVYPKAAQWMKANGKVQNGAVIEIYKKGGMKKEIKYMFPIK